MSLRLYIKSPCSVERQRDINMYFMNFDEQKREREKGEGNDHVGCFKPTRQFYSRLKHRRATSNANDERNFPRRDHGSLTNRMNRIWRRGRVGAQTEVIILYRIIRLCCATPPSLLSSPLLHWIMPVVAPVSDLFIRLVAPTWACTYDIYNAGWLKARVVT